jgi:hypothetical protein
MMIPKSTISIAAETIGIHLPTNLPALFVVANGRSAVGAQTGLGNLCGNHFERVSDIGDVPGDDPGVTKGFGFIGCPKVNPVNLRWSNLPGHETLDRIEL